MFNLIEKLRAKPERVKTQIAFAVALLVSGIIFVFWLGVIYPDWKVSQGKQDSVAKLEPSPTASLMDTFSNSFEAMGVELNNIKSAISSFSTLPVHYSTSTKSGSSSTNSQ